MIKEENLLFIISQPRSGSSMLQQLLLNSDEIISAPEPWLMLPLVYSFKKFDCEQGYNPRYAHINLENYLKRYDQGQILIKEKIKNIALDLYNLNKLVGNQKYFLDKTTRYFHIIEELQELFPKSKFIYLTRNPLSVFSSLIELYGTNVYLKPDRYDDIFIGPINLAKAIENKNNSSIVVKYEDLVLSQDVVLNKLKLFLKLDNDIRNSYRLSEDFKKSRAFDPKSLSKHNQPVTNYIEAWKLVINNFQKKKMALEYIKRIEDSCFKSLGYSKNDILNNITSHDVRNKLNLFYIRHIIHKLKIKIREIIKFIYRRINQFIK